MLNTIHVWNDVFCLELQMESIIEKATCLLSTERKKNMMSVGSWDRGCCNSTIIIITFTTSKRQNNKIYVPHYIKHLHTFHKDDHQVNELVSVVFFLDLAINTEKCSFYVVIQQKDKDVENRKYTSVIVWGHRLHDL